MKKEELEPLRLVIPQTEAMDSLGAQVFRDTIAARWLEPCCFKPGRTPRKRARVFYAKRDIERCVERINKGEYPEPPRTEPKPLKRSLENQTTLNRRSAWKVHNLGL